jgi:hypothetical protein
MTLSACGVKATETPTATFAPSTNTPLPTKTITPMPTATPTPRFAKTDWNVGLPYGIPDITIAANVKDFGAKGDGASDDSSAFMKAIRDTNSGAILVPAGTYLIKSPLEINTSVVLRGEGADKTHLLFDLTGISRHALYIRNQTNGSWTDVKGGFTKGSTSLTVASASAFKPDSFAEIQQTNDPNIMYTNPLWKQDWAENSVGEIVKVISVSENTIILESPLKTDYREDLKPQIRTIGIVKNAGIENLHIKRLDEVEGKNIINFSNTAYCWLRNIESEYSPRCHIEIWTSYGCEIRDSYFHHAPYYGGNGEGYGVSIIQHTTNCLVENNIFVHLRHSMIIQVGASGNVFGYNYSREPYATDGSWKGELCDISIHGHYPSYNLFEGNVVQQIDISDWWGPVGLGNILFRNRVESKKGISVKDHSHSQIIIGNELATGTIHIDNTVKETIVNGNMIKGEITWEPSNAEHELPASYYYDQKPPFYNSLTYPSSGSDLPNGTNPAFERYKSGNYVALLS